MKIKKMSFNNIKEILSRDEMKKIVAGSGGGGGSSCNIYCHNDAATYCKNTCLRCKFFDDGPNDWLCTQ